MDAKIDSNIVRRLVLQTAIWLPITALVLFVSAGTIRWPQAWVYMALLGSFGLLSGLSLAQHDPELVRERMRGPIQREQKPWDKVLLLVIFPLFVGQYVISGLDAVRFHVSDMPLWLEVLGAAGVLLGLYIFHIVLRANSYAAAVVKVQKERGHQVISTGPYAWVRHPMYAGAILFFLGTALLLGSWYAFAIGLVLIALFGLRAVWEEDTLKAELPGYPDYAARVRYRFVPGVW
jgi:protein-S-isoprenylcysteine O-methyltransferase Ste14